MPRAPQRSALLAGRPRAKRRVLSIRMSRTRSMPCSRARSTRLTRRTGTSRFAVAENTKASAASKSGGLGGVGVRRSSAAAMRSSRGARAGSDGDMAAPGRASVSGAAGCVSRRVAVGERLDLSVHKQVRPQLSPRASCVDPPIHSGRRSALSSQGVAKSAEGEESSAKHGSGGRERDGRHKIKSDEAVAEVLAGQGNFRSGKNDIG